MRYLLKALNLIPDTCLSWFIPAWRRQGRDAYSALTRYLRYHGPDLDKEKLGALTTLRGQLSQSLDYWRKDEVTRLSEKTASLAEGLRGFKRGAIIEMAESFFVIMVIFLGIRTYYAQPFRIPTGSMQPTLNGITIHPLSEEEASPSLLKKGWDALVRGSSYVDITIDSPKHITGLDTETYCFILTRTKISFNQGEPAYVPCASGAVAEYLRNNNKLGRTLMPGETLIRARMDAGDMVVVNRMAYHFRRPERGETFVFDTRGINTDIPRSMPDQSLANHYIKRLCGLPGDSISIRSPQLLVNGAPTQEPAIARVAACQPPYNGTGYNALSREKDPLIYDKAYFREGATVTLRQRPQDPNSNEYLALGDNTVNSKDSRYWGPVHQFNVLGPAFFTLWPFLPHWGGIE